MKRKLWTEDIERIALATVNMVQEITGLSDDDPRVDKLLDALTDGALDDPGISYQEYRSHN